MNREFKEAIIFLAPLVLLLLIFVLMPVAGTIWNSMFKDVTFMERVFIGLRNYQRLFTSSQFWQSSLFTLMFPIVSVSLEVDFAHSFNVAEDGFLDIFAAKP